MLIAEPGLYPDIPEDVYHGDPVEGGSLSSTGAKTILDSPARFAYDRTHSAHKPVFDIGTACHELVLGTGGGIVVVEADSWRTAAAKASREAAYADGKTPVLAAEYVEIQAMADAVLMHPTAARLLEAATEREVSLFAPDAETGYWRRGRVDALAPRYAADLKTAVSANPATWGKKSGDLGYHVQAAWYLELLADVGHSADRFIHVAVEKTAPYLVSVCELDAEALAVGRRLARQAMDIYAACRASDDWPGYGDLINLVRLPAWAVRAAEKENDL